MREVRRVMELIASVERGDPWHGPSTRAVLEGTSAQEAAARPIPNAHTIWEIVLHLTAWAREVRRRILGGEPALPAEGDWPEPPKATEGAWAESLADFAVAHAGLLAALEGFPGERMDEIVDGARNGPLGTGTSYGAMLAGVALHDSYHTGQIALIRKAIARP